MDLVRQVWEGLPEELTTEIWKMSERSFLGENERGAALSKEKEKHV